MTARFLLGGPMSDQAVREKSLEMLRGGNDARQPLFHQQVRPARAHAELQAIGCGMTAKNILSYHIWYGDESGDSIVNALIPQDS